MRLLRKHSSATPIDGLPTELQLFKVGENASTKGSVFYDPKNASALRANQAANDTRDKLFFDLAHLSLTDVGTVEAHKAYAWFDLDFAEDGVWARNIEWTAEGAELLRSRSFRYWSPAFYVDEDARITEVVSVALTNVPASLDIEPLVASKKELMENDEQKTDEELTLLSDTDTDENDDDDKADEPETNEDDTTDESTELTPDEMKAAIEDLTKENAALVGQVKELQSKLDAAGSSETDSTLSALAKDGLITSAQLKVLSKLDLATVVEFAKETRAGSSEKRLIKRGKEQPANDEPKLSPIAQQVIKHNLRAAK